MKRIKLIDLFESIISEGASSIVYHKTHTNAIYRILKTDKFKLTTSATGVSDVDFRAGKGRTYFFSTARNRDSSYFNAVGDYSVILTIDGRKLNSKLKAFPFDYWGRDFGGGNQAGGLSDENEDRFVSSDEYVPNASKYITKIEILLPSEYENPISSLQRKLNPEFRDLSDDKIAKLQGKRFFSDKSGGSKEILRNILIEAKKKNIPVLFYFDEKSFKYGKEQNSIEFDVKDLTGRSKGKWDDKSYYSHSFKDSNLEFIIKLYYDDATQNNYDKMEYKLKDKLNKLVVYGGTHRFDFDLVTKNRLRSSNRYAKRVVKIMQKEKLDFKELIDMLLKKWEPIVQKNR